MSTIDAAIIKALVEHIGGNSSTIPDGAIGGLNLTKQRGRVERWVNPDGSNRNEFCLVDYDICSGDILRLKFVDRNKTFYRDYMYLIIKDGGSIEQWISLDDMLDILTFTRTTGIYRTDEGNADDAADDIENDDNVGIYRISDPILAGFFKLFSMLMTTIHPDAF